MLYNICRERIKMDNKIETSLKVGCKNFLWVK